MIAGVNDATAGEMGSLNEVKHAFVVAMGIDADIIALRWAPIKYDTEDTSLLPIRGYTMDSAIEQGII